METLEYKFVKSIPEVIENMTLYVSMEYGTAIHKCVCGCGNEVITPFSPTDWELTYNGEAISLSPSIGNWSFKCQSHYWIVENKIIHASKWSQYEIDHNRKADKKNKKEFYSKKKVENSQIEEEFIISNELSESFSRWKNLKKFFVIFFSKFYIKKAV
jgi:hypothetical protein